VSFLIIINLFHRREIYGALRIFIGPLLFEIFYHMHKKRGRFISAPLFTNYLSATPARLLLAASARTAITLLSAGLHRAASVLRGAALLARKGHARGQKHGH
jgi:hypothetical protein